MPCEHISLDFSNCMLCMDSLSEIVKKEEIDLIKTDMVVLDLLSNVAFSGLPTPAFRGGGWGKSNSRMG